MPNPTRWHSIQIEFVTPSFLGQAGPGSVPFPVASLRGTLRYWLRALVGAHVGNNLDALSTVESAVFGGASGETGQPSTVLLRAGMVDYQSPAQADQWTGRKVPPYLAYLLGQGLYQDGRLTRAYLRPGHRVTVKIRQNRGGQPQWTLFCAALWALRTFGGLGARARRGFGTFRLADTDLPALPEWLTATTVEHLGDVFTAVGWATATLLKRTVEIDPEALPTYPRFDAAVPQRWHWTEDHDLGIAAGQRNVGSALTAVGERLRRFRLSWDQDTPPDTPPPHGPDYPAVKAFLDHGTEPAGTIKVAALGLPVMYADPAPGNGRRSAAVEPFPTPVAAPRAQPPPAATRPSPAMFARRPAPAPRVAMRRASPLWLRLYDDGRSWHLRSLAFYAEFLPPGAGLGITDKTSDKVASHKRQVRQPVPTPTLADVEDVLDRWFDHQNSWS